MSFTIPVKRIAQFPITTCCGSRGSIGSFVNDVIENGFEDDSPVASSHDTTGSWLLITVGCRPTAQGPTALRHDPSGSDELFPDRGFVRAQLRGNDLAFDAIGAVPDDATSLRHRTRYPPPADETLQTPLLLGLQKLEASSVDHPPSQCFAPHP